MRKGKNISKDRMETLSTASHRVIIPLYIPFEEDYYKEAYGIFEYSLFSLIKTSLTKLKITVVSNNCCNSVNEKLFDLQKKESINELIIVKEPIGKINSILKALRSTEERLITISDADVLFLNGWEKAIVEVFEEFPNAGAVCPTPVFRKHLHLTSAIWFKYLFSKKLYFRPVKNAEAMERFAQSLGWDSLENRFKDVIVTLKSNSGSLAVLGCSHFVATYKREVFKRLPKGNSKYILGGDSEFLYLDQPVTKQSGYRLATYDNYAFHLGNTLEPWMIDAYDSLKTEIKVDIDYNRLKKIKQNIFENFISEKIFKKIFYSRKIYNYILLKKGLTKEQLKTFWY